MNPLTISYLDHNLHVISAEERDSTPLPDGYAVMDDNRWDDCFALLVEGKDVAVRCYHGIRHLYDFLTNRYRFVKAAGGLVEAPDGELLMISREGHWDLPKGMVESAEHLSAAALREVREETGVQHLTLGKLMLKTYHIYDKYGGWHLKQTSWFRMYAAEKQVTVPQQEEGITEAVWVPKELCRTRLEGSFATLRMLNMKLK